MVNLVSHRVDHNEFVLNDSADHVVDFSFLVSHFPIWILRPGTIVLLLLYITLSFTILFRLFLVIVQHRLAIGSILILLLILRR